MANTHNRNTRSKKLRYRRRLFASLLFLTIIVGGVIYLAVKLLTADTTPALNETNTQTEESVSSTETPSSEEAVSTEEITSTEETVSTEEIASTEESDETTAPDDSLKSDPSSYDNTCQNWGQGLNFDELNRPVRAVEEQEKYEDFGAYFIKDTTAKEVYLTFDEGYENGYTSQILDVLKEKNVKAVFFVTLSYVKRQPDLVNRMIEEGHIIGNHSVSHKEGGLPSQSLEEQTNEVMELHQYMLDNFQYEMHIFRFPSGKYSEQSMMSVKNCNYKSIFWSFAYKDYDVENQPEPSAALEKLTARLHPGAIYLLHAVSETNTNILGDFIDRAKANGYRFVTF